MNLQGDIVDPDGEGPGTVASEDGATGGGTPGAWSATFHGSVTGDGGTPEIFPKPSAVVGEFNANFSNGSGSAAGGFGARKQ